MLKRYLRENSLFFHICVCIKDDDQVTVRPLSDTKLTQALFMYAQIPKLMTVI